MQLLFIYRSTEGLGSDIATHLLGNAGSSTWSPGLFVLLLAFACTSLLKQRTITITHTRCGTSWWPHAWCSCCHQRRRTERHWAGAGAGVGAGAGAGDPGSVDTLSVRAARMNSTLSHSETRDVVRK